MLRHDRRAGRRSDGRRHRPRRDAGHRRRTACPPRAIWAPSRRDSSSRRSRSTAASSCARRSRSARPAARAVRRSAVLRVAGDRRPAIVAAPGSRPARAVRRRGRATSAAAAPSSGAAPIARRGCSSSIATTERFADARRVARPGGARDRPTSRRALVADRSAAGQRIFYRVLFQDLVRPARLERAGRRQLHHAGGDAARRHARLVRRHRRPGLGHQPGLGRAAALRNDAPARSPTSSSTSATRSTPTSRVLPEVKLDDGTIWKNVVTRGEVEGGGDARRLPRLPSVQPDRRAHAPLHRRGRRRS